MKSQAEDSWDTAGLGVASMCWGLLFSDLEFGALGVGFRA